MRSWSVIGTVLADDPRLTARDEKGKPLARQPLRVVVDTLGRLPATARLLKEPGETLLAVGPGIDPIAEWGPWKRYRYPTISCAGGAH